MDSHADKHTLGDPAGAACCCLQLMRNKRSLTAADLSIGGLIPNTTMRKTLGRKHNAQPSTQSSTAP
jgi:hypothetical protein